MISQHSDCFRSAVPSRLPEIRTTGFDRTVAALTTAASASMLLLTVAVIVWLANSLSGTTDPGPADRPAVRFQSLGDEAVVNQPEAAPEVASPFTSVPDISVANEEGSVTDIHDSTSAVAEAAVAAGEVGSLDENTAGDGQGRSGLSTVESGPRIGQGGANDDRTRQRWIIEFEEPSSLTQYAAQLAFFGIEPALLLKDEGKIVYLSDLTSEKPASRTVLREDAAAENRFFMNWADGSAGLIEADRALFSKAGFSPGDAPILHFYPDGTEAILEKLELEYAGESNRSRIRRTYFSVRRITDGFEFFVRRQTIL